MGYSIRDVAKIANVSAMTVSRVLSFREGKIPVSEETRQRLMSVCRELKYEPNIHAQRMLSNRSHTIAMVVPPQKKIEAKHHIFSDYNISELLSAIEESLSERGYKTLLMSMNQSFMKNKEYIKLFRNKSIDGMLLWGVHLNENYVLDLLKEESLFLLINSYLIERDVNCVMVDNFAGAYKVTEHLIKLGHRRIAFVKGPADVAIGVDRFNGYKSALEKNGLPYEENLVFTGDYSEETGYQVTKREILKMQKLPRAIFGINDTTAIGVLRAVKEKGLKIPEDIAVAGGDGIPLTAYTAPPLTTFKVPMYELGLLAVEKLLALVEKGENGTIEGKLQPELIIRASTDRAIQRELQT